MNEHELYELVVHCKRDEYDVYIGRPRGNSEEHYGNPFSHQTGTKAQVHVATRDDSVQAYDDWLGGIDWLWVEPERRRWILNHLEDLRGKRLGCWCAPQHCHGHPLARRANR